MFFFIPDEVSLCPFLKKLNEFIQVTYYLVRSGRVKCDRDDGNGLDNITFEDLETAVAVRVIQASSKLYETLTTPLVPRLTDYDLGYTILFMNFAIYNTVGRYTDFVLIFRHLDCMKEFEVYMSKNRYANINAEYTDLGIHAKHGLLKNYHRFTNTRCLTRHLAMSLLLIPWQRGTSMATLSPEDYVSHLNILHIDIISSFYAITSNSKMTSSILECRDAANATPLHAAIKPINTYVLDDCEYWFHVPSGSVWFTYSKEGLRYHGLCNNELPIKTFREIGFTIVGFVHGASLNCVSLIHDIAVQGRWDVIINIFSSKGLYSPLIHRSMQKPYQGNKTNRVLYVKSNNDVIYQYLGRFE